MTVKEMIEKKFQNHSVKYELVAPEGGWGIAVVFSLSLMFIVTVVPMATFGMVYGPFLASVGDETSGTTIVNGMFNTILCFTGLAANQLLQKTSYRKVGLVGAVIYFSGSFSTIFVTSLFQLILSFGVLQGLGFGLMMPAVFTAFNLYFDKKKNFTMSVAQATMVAATIGIPALMKFLLSYYGFRGTVAILSAISLHIFPAMAVLQPVEWHLKKRKVSLVEMANVNEKEVLKKAEGEPLLDEQYINGRFALEVPRKSLVSIGSIAMSVTSLNKLQLHNDEKSDGLWKTLAKALDLGLFKDPVYVNIVFGLALGVTSDLAFLSVLPLLLYGAGLTADEMTLIMTVFFLADLACRILLSVLSAMTTLTNRYLFLWGAAGSAAFRCAFVMNNSFLWLASISAVLGFFRALIQTPLPLVIAEKYPERFVTAFSLYMVVCGVVSMTFGPLTGIIKALTESNAMVVHLLTVAYLLCAVPWSFELIFTKLRRTKTSAGNEVL